MVVGDHLLPIYQHSSSSRKSHTHPTQNQTNLVGLPTGTRSLATIEQLVQGFLLLKVLLVVEGQAVGDATVNLLLAAELPVHLHTSMSRTNRVSPWSTTRLLLPVGAGHLTEGGCLVVVGLDMHHGEVHREVVVVDSILEEGVRGADEEVGEIGKR